MQWRATAKKPWRPVATTTTPSRWKWRVCWRRSNPCWASERSLGRTQAMPESPGFATARRTFHVLGSAALVVAALYWGQKIVIPFALALLLAFVLSPLVARLERRGLRR